MLIRQKKKSSVELNNDDLQNKTQFFKLILIEIEIIELPRA
jgi:hypothetical protein